MRSPATVPEPGPLAARNEADGRLAPVAGEVDPWHCANT